MQIDINTVATQDLARAIARASVLERRDIPSRNKRRKIEAAVKDAQCLPIGDLANAITFNAQAADEIRIYSGKLLCVLRARIERGDEGADVKWYEWARKNLGKGESRLRELQRIGQAKDPWHELERQRRLAEGRKIRMKAKRKLDYDAGLREFIREFAKSGTIAELKSTVDHIANLRAERR